MATPDGTDAHRTMRPRAGSSAKALLLTILGELVLPNGSVIWTSTVIRALGVLGVEERNARQAIARLAERGIVRGEKDGRKTRWWLTDWGQRLLVDGTERIYRFPGVDDGWDGRWLVVVSSVPEEQPAKRHQLRSQLGFAGFGFLSPGVAVCPHVDREPVATTILERLGLLPGALVLRAETGDAVSADELLRRAWDLETLAEGYRTFIVTFERRSPRTDDERFAALVELVHAWRRFPFVDPEIPAELLPSRWPGHRAKQLFDAKHAAWVEAAGAWYLAAEAAAN